VRSFGIAVRAQSRSAIVTRMTVGIDGMFKAAEEVGADRVGFEHLDLISAAAQQPAVRIPLT